MTISAKAEAWLSAIAAKGYSEDDRDFIRDYFLSPCEPVPDKKWEYLTDTEQYRLLASDRIGSRLESDGLVAWDDDLNLILVLPGMPPLDDEEWLAAVENHGSYSIDDVGVIIRDVLGGLGSKYPDIDAVDALFARLERDGFLKWDHTRTRWALLIPQDAVVVGQG